MLPIVEGWKPVKYIRIDELPKLKGKFAIHFHLEESLGKAHIKLEYGNTPYCLSLFVFDIRKFYFNEKVRVRSYDLWPKEIMFNAHIGKYDPKSGKLEIIKKVENPYRDDAVIVDWGNYELQNSIIEFNFETRELNLKYKIEFYRVVKYYSPKYGYSVRSEYWFIPLQ